MNHTFKKPLAACMMVALTAVASHAFAHGHAGHGAHSSSAATDAKAAEKKPELVNAVVRKIDVDAKKITLKHEEIKSLDMTAMTMVFQVKDAKMLEGLKAGDKVKFSAEQTKGGFAVTSIEVAK